ASLLRDLDRHAGWQHLKSVFEYAIAQRQHTLTSLSLIHNNDLSNVLRGQIGMLRKIITQPGRIAESLEEELRESAEERKEQRE
ncbi:MAG: hypothetical protein V3W19_07155, partial [Desulfatiglandales bacterium]